MTEAVVAARRLRQLVTNSIQNAWQDADTSSDRKVWVGFSGGLDSTVLLHVLSSVPHARAIHVNHNISPNSDAWESHCRNVCQSLEVPLVVEHVSVAPNGNLEANARAVRYEAFSKHVLGSDLLATAHHADDVLETVLLKLFQGRALDGLPKYNIIGNVHVVRPLLELKRTELEHYAQANSLSWIEDESNADTRFDRNFLRVEVLPKLRTRWPDLADRLNRVAGSANSQKGALDHQMVRYLDRELLVKDLPKNDEAAIATLRSYLDLKQQFQVTDVAIREFLTQVRAGQNAKVVWSGGGLQLMGEKICVLNSGGD